MTAVAVVYLIAEVVVHRAHWNLAWLERFGRSSLFVYWIHVELVYGYASWPLRGRLPLWGTLVACAVFSLLMYRAVLLRDRMVENWRARPRARSGFTNRNRLIACGRMPY